MAQIEARLIRRLATVLRTCHGPGPAGARTTRRRARFGMRSDGSRFDCASASNETVVLTPARAAPGGTRPPLPTEVPGPPTKASKLACRDGSRTLA